MRASPDTSARLAVAPPPTREVVRGEVRWGVKAGFRGYVADLPDGACRTSEEVRHAPDGRFVFPVIGRDPASGMIRIAGSVNFSGHAGALDVSVAHLGIHPQAEAWDLWGEGPPGRGQQVLATGMTAVGAEGRLLISLRLAPAGAALFEGNYTVGTALDVLELTMPTGA